MVCKASLAIQEGTKLDDSEGRARLSPFPWCSGERQGASVEQDGSPYARAWQAGLGRGEVVEPPWVWETRACCGPDTKLWSQPLAGTPKDAASRVRCRSSPGGSGLLVAPPATCFSTHEDLI